MARAGIDPLAFVTCGADIRPRAACARATPTPHERLKLPRERG